MWVTPFGGALFEKIVRNLANKIIYDIEDNILISQGNKLNPIAKLEKKSKIKYLIRTSDHVITSSPFLNDYCLGINDKSSCTYISSSVDTDKFIPNKEFKKDRKVTLGWTGTLVRSRTSIYY